MKKTFPLQAEGKHPDRLLDALKHDLRRYMARERRRALPEGTDFWDFDCRFGASEDSAQPLHPAELIRALDALAQGGGTQCYVELLAKPVRRRWAPRPGEADAASAEDGHPAQSTDAQADADDRPEQPPA